MCVRGWNGTRCEQQTCVHDCLNGGVCGPDLQCVCRLGFKGPRCDRQVTVIPEGSGSGGGSDAGDGDTSGSSGSSPPTLPALPNEPGVTGPKPGDCLHGLWQLNDKKTTASCDCDSGWDGEHCTQVTCPGDDGPCNGNGVCDLTTTPDNPTCTCKLGWLGADCATLPCPHDCGKDEEDGPHGECISDECVCTVEWEGADCMTRTSVRTDLPCSQDCPLDCEHAVDCEQYELRYWVPIWHKKSLTTDRLYSWVTPDTGKNFQYELNEAKDLGRPVPMDDQNYGDQARKCYLGCVERCVAKCFNALHMMTEERRQQTIVTQQLSKRLPGITGNHIKDIDKEVGRTEKGLPRLHHDYSAAQIIDYLEKLTKATEGGVKDQLPKGDNPVVVNSAGDPSFERNGATDAVGAPAAEGSGSGGEVAGAATMQASAEVEAGAAAAAAAPEEGGGAGPEAEAVAAVTSQR